jgi:Flp pilus assembly protein TadG
MDMVDSKLVADTSASQSQDRQRGAALVEFALVLPLLMALLFGLIEMSWAFAQLSDVRYGAREGARAAAVEIGNMATLGQATCDSMDIVGPTQNIDVILTPVNSSPAMPGEGSVGASAQITVTADLQTVTGFYDILLGGKTITSTVEFRLEQPATGGGDSAWWAEAALGSPTDTYSCP